MTEYNAIEHLDALRVLFTELCIVIQEPTLEFLYGTFRDSFDFILQDPIPPRS